MIHVNFLLLKIIFLVIIQSSLLVLFLSIFYLVLYLLVKVASVVFLILVLSSSIANFTLLILSLKISQLGLVFAGFVKFFTLGFLFKSKPGYNRSARININFDRMAFENLVRVLIIFRVLRLPYEFYFHPPTPLLFTPLLPILFKPLNILIGKFIVYLKIKSIHFHL